MNKNFLFGTFLVLSSTFSAFGWGQKGHDTIAFIAENHLTPTTRSAVENLLDNHSIVYFSNWMDNASNTPEYAYSKTWHYKNIDAGIAYEDAAINQDGDIVTAILSQTKTLQNKKASPSEMSLALKMLIHLIGDIHQPMHMGHLSDRGGNNWIIKYFGTDTKLHSLWDSPLLESAHKWSYTEWQQQIDRVSEATANEIISDGNPDKWGKECFLIATNIYDTTPQNSKLSYDYIAKWTPIIEQQLLRGGLRLADVLNSIFDNNYKRKNNFVKLNNE